MTRLTGARKGEFLTSLRDGECGQTGTVGRQQVMSSRWIEPRQRMRAGQCQSSSWSRQHSSR